MRPGSILPSPFIPRGGDLSCHKVLAGLLLLDAAFILAHVALYVFARAGLPAPIAIAGFFNITTDRSLPEFYLYAKWLAVSLLLLCAWNRWRIPLFAGLAVVFLIVLLDDSLSLHENIGAKIAGALNLGPAFGLRAQDFGELAAWALLGTGVVGAAVTGYRRSTQADRPLVYPFLIAFAALLLVGIGLDMLGMAVKTLAPPSAPRGAISLAFGIAEDGGEMLIGSVFCVLALGAAQGRRDARPGARTR